MPYLLALQGTQTPTASLAQSHVFLLHKYHTRIRTLTHFLLCIDPNSIAPGCLYRLLRTDRELRALTIEGWVKITRPAGGGPAGGVVMSVGQDTDRTGALTPECQTENKNNRDYVNICMISTL
jgi:hypothetical protein